ncbi:MAG: DNA polymerase I [Desulfobacterales bacterium]|nr:DNA polymerase I [Desulfobacterales bacterium]MCP4160279.1 DNA polymerase I [Deltaproteobacteria bacterium]
MEKTIYLIDGSAYIYRAYHAIRNLTNSEGLPTNAVFGFTNMLTKLLDDKSPEYTVMFFDMKGPTFRHEMYKEYKANRPPMPDDLQVQIPFIKEVTRGFNIPIVELQGFEADDLIGTFADLAEKEGLKTIMVTGDKDFMQLVTEKSIIWDPMKDLLIDRNYVLEKVGVEPDRVIDVMALTGDSADNIPGVPGIGKKTAPLLIQEHGSLEGLYEVVDGITKKKQRENLIENKDIAFLSRDLVTIKKDVDISFNYSEYKKGPFNNQILSDLFKKLEFRKHLAKYATISDPLKQNYYTITDKNELNKLITSIKKCEIVSVDTETTSKIPMEAKLVGISFSYEEGSAFYIPIAHSYPGAPVQLDFDETLTQLKEILEDPSIKKTGQNIKYDYIVFSKYGIELKGIEFDSIIASYIINPAKRVHSLDELAMDYLGHKTIPYEKVAGKGSNQVTFDKVLIEDATNYSCEDADLALKLRNVLYKELEKRDQLKLFNDIEMPLMPVLMKMEKNGIKIDLEKLQNLSLKLENSLKEKEELIYSMAGEEFNINSPTQLGRILFEVLELPVKKKTKKKTGYSTDVDVLTELSDKHELPALVLQYRSISKLKSTYTDALQEVANPETSRVHTSFNQTVTVTGRLSSSNPNLQNIPIRTEEGREIREAFIPEEGFSIISADYSQIELRILAHCSNDEILIDSFNKDEDIHQRTAAEVFGAIPEMITEDLRAQAKAVNFGIIYGMSPYGLSKELGISMKMAKSYIENYFERYKGVNKFIEDSIAEAKSTNKTTTLLGRVRFIPEINSSKYVIRNFAERVAINTPVQGTAADLIKVAMIKVSEKLEEMNLKTRMLLTVHDEILLESPIDEVEVASDMLKDVMENIWELKVPLKVNISAGKNWAKAH